jgi:hypothetical protein
VLSPPQRRPTSLVKRACFRPQSGSKFTLLLHLPRHRHHRSALQALISTFLGISDLIPNPCTYVSELILISRRLRPLDDTKTTHRFSALSLFSLWNGTDVAYCCVSHALTFPLASPSPTDTQPGALIYLLHLVSAPITRFLNSSRSLYCMQHVPHPHPLCVSQAPTLVFVAPLTASMCIRS